MTRVKPITECTLGEPLSADVKSPDAVCGLCERPFVMDIIGGQLPTIHLLQDVDVQQVRLWMCTARMPGGKGG